MDACPLIFYSSFLLRPSQPVGTAPLRLSRHSIVGLTLLEEKLLYLVDIRTPTHHLHGESYVCSYLHCVRYRSLYSFQSCGSEEGGTSARE